MSAYKDRIAAGQCGKCGNPNSNGSSLCDGCKAKERDRATKKREANRAAGGCTNCGKPVSKRSATKCDHCLDIGAATARKARQTRKEEGTCQACGQRPPKPGRTVCQECSTRMSEFRLADYYRFKTAGLCRICGEQPEEGYAFCTKHREQDRDRKLQYKLDAMDAYGGPVCVGCGETTFDVLEIDHINGGGCKHRKEIGPGNSIYRWLKAQGYPPGFRVLCPNCNKRAHRKLPLPNDPVSPNST